jgi:hypothetical protein
LYFERVEGVRSLRPLLAFMLVLSFWGRALVAAKASRAAVHGFWPTLPIAEGGGRAVDVVRTASVVCLGLFFYLLVLATASLISPIFAMILSPILILRGLVAPSWLARASIAEDGGLAVFVRALGDTTGMRLRGAAIELLLLLGTFGLAINLYLVMVIGLILLRSLLGLDLASVDAFLSLRNPFVGASIVLLSFVLFEPLRVALSAYGYVDARVRREGLDLAAAIDDAVRASEGRGGRRSAVRGGMAALVLLAPLVLSLHPSAVFAQTLSSEAAPAGVETDDRVREDVAEILARPEFVELENDDGRNLDALMRQLLAWLIEQSQRQNLDAAPPFTLPMPPTWFFIAMGCALLLVVSIYLLLTRTRRKKSRPKGAARDAEKDDDPRERAPEAHLDDAALLSEAGRYRDALRSLYLATLVALDRQRLITFDPSRTNWHYLRHLPRDSRRLDFSHFTRLFDHKWYGDEVTTEEDYRACRALANRIVERSAAESASSTEGASPVSGAA